MPVFAMYRVRQICPEMQVNEMHSLYDKHCCLVNSVGRGRTAVREVKGSSPRLTNTWGLKTSETISDSAECYAGL